MRRIVTFLLLVGVVMGQTKSSHPTQKPKPETCHIDVVKEYIRELIEDEDLKATGEKELSDAKTLNEQFSAGIYYSKSTQLELRSQIRMLKTMHLNDPFDTLIPSLTRFYQQQIELHQRLIDITSSLMGGPKEGVDYRALPAKMPEIRLNWTIPEKQCFKRHHSCSWR
jgi:hypothetical protein